MMSKISPAVKALGDKIDARVSKIDEVLKDKGTADKRTPKKSDVFGEPTARKGESVMTSRGYQFQRAIGVKTGLLKPEQAKLELEVHQKMYDHFCGKHGFNTANDIVTQTTGGVVIAPFATDMMGSKDETDEGFRHEMKSLVLAGTANADPEEMTWIARKAYSQYGMKVNQSWLDETLGGALVAPPEFGELIQLLRNKDALINAGCRTVPLPPSGRLKYPRQTTATTGYWVGENTSITAANFGTGSLLLSAKKVAALVTMPNELIRFASPASEAILRADMTKTLSLTLDKACLEGPGSDTTPLGILLTPGVATVTPTTTGNDGNTLSPQDVYKFISAVEANNAEFQGFVLRPELFYNLVMVRAGVYNSSAAAIQGAGQFVYDQFRELGQGFKKVLAGYPATTTAQVSITRVKGNGSNLTYVIGGQWDDAIMAMFGTIEFAQAFQGDTAFAQDQVVVRAILTADFGLRHAGAFAVADTLIQTVGLL